MYVCMYIYIYIYIYIYNYMCAYIDIDTYIYTYMLLLLCIYVYMYIYVCIYIYIYIYIHAYIHIHRYVCFTDLACVCVRVALRNLAVISVAPTVARLPAVCRITVCYRPSKSLTRTPPNPILYPSSSKPQILNSKPEGLKLATCSPSPEP